MTLAPIERTSTPSNKTSTVLADQLVSSGSNALVAVVAATLLTSEGFEVVSVALLTALVAAALVRVLTVESVRRDGLGVEWSAVGPQALALALPLVLGGLALRPMASAGSMLGVSLGLLISGPVSLFEAKRSTMFSLGRAEWPLKADALWLVSSVGALLVLPRTASWFIAAWGLPPLLMTAADSVVFATRPQALRWPRPNPLLVAEATVEHGYNWLLTLVLAATSGGVAVGAFAGLRPVFGAATVVPLAAANIAIRGRSNSLQFHRLAALSAGGVFITALALTVLPLAALAPADSAAGDIVPFVGAMGFFFAAQGTMQVYRHWLRIHGSLRSVIKLRLAAGVVALSAVVASAQLTEGPLSVPGAIACTAVPTLCLAIAFARMASDPATPRPRARRIERGPST